MISSEHETFRIKRLYRKSVFKTCQYYSLLTVLYMGRTNYSVPCSLGNPRQFFSIEISVRSKMVEKAKDKDCDEKEL